MAASNQKVIPQYDANRMLHIRLDDKYWSVLFAMTQIDGQTPEEYCKAAIESEITMNLDDPEYFGEHLCDGWRKELGDGGRK